MDTSYTIITYNNSQSEMPVITNLSRWHCGDALEMKFHRCNLFKNLSLSWMVKRKGTHTTNSLLYASAVSRTDYESICVKLVFVISLSVVRCCFFIVWHYCSGYTVFFILLTPPESKSQQRTSFSGGMILFASQSQAP